MTTITYSSGGDTHLLPSVAYAANGAVVSSGSSRWIIQNPATGYRISFLSSTDDFTEDGSGDISEVTISDSHGHVYADFTNLSGDIELANILQTAKTQGTRA